jgi:solute carrier family 12 (sodium/potassium/chloride transporter), member 2
MFVPDVNWGSSTQAQMYKTALSTAHSLARTGEHVKNYWPQLLVLGGPPHARPALLDMGNLITKASSLMIVGDISEVRPIFTLTIRAIVQLGLSSN